MRTLRFAGGVLFVAACWGQQRVELLQGPQNQPYTASPDPQADSIVIGTAPTWGISVVATSQATWLTFKSDCASAGAGSAAAAGITPVTFVFCVDPSRVTANGYYVGLIEVTSPGYATLQVSVRLTRFPTGNLAAVPDDVSLNAGRLTETIAVTVDPNGQNNNDAGFTNNLAFTAALSKPSPPEGQWLTVSQGSPTTPGSVVLTANPALVSGAGTYVNTVVLRDTRFNDIKTVKVSLTVGEGDLQSVSALPHIAVGGGFVTGFYLINNGSAPATATIRFYDDSGQPMSIPITGVGNSTTLTDNLNARGSSYYEAGNPQAALRGGWALATAGPSVTVQALFRLDAGGGRFFEAAVPSSTGGRGFLIPFDATTFAPSGVPLYTGLAIANLDSNAQANITCVARDSAGNTIPNALTIPPLSRLGHYAEYNFPNLSGRRGTLECSSNTNIAATALRFIGTGNAFSSLPVLILR